MRSKSHVRFGERDGRNRQEQSWYDAPIPTQRSEAPSPDDVAITRAIHQAGELLDIPLVDHIIIGHGGRYASLKERKQGFPNIRDLA